MTRVKASTQQGQGIIADSKRQGYGTIWQAYERCSDAKINSYRMIHDRALHTEGYNYDLRVIGKNSMMYSTIYTYTDVDNRLHIIKDTAYNTYEVVIDA